MLKQILKRILISIPILLIISIVVFLIIKFIPGDPVQMMFGRSPNAKQIEMIQGLYNLDKPVYTQYWLWLSNLAHGNWGESITLKLPVMQLVMERLPRTASLCLLSVALSIIIAFPTGITSAVRNNTLSDVSLTTFNLLLISIPSMFFGLILIIVFAVQLHWLPTSGYTAFAKDAAGWLRSTIMPAVTLAATLCASTSRYLRSSILETMSQDYVMLARAKGNRESRVLYIHTLRNALIPVITQIGMQISFLMGGEVVIEKVFVYPGLGMLMLGALQNRDYPLIQASIMTFAILVVGMNILIDSSYMLLDPRISFGKKKVA